MPATLLSLPRELRQHILFLVVKLTFEDVDMNLIREEDEHSDYPCAHDDGRDRMRCQWCQQQDPKLFVANPRQGSRMQKMLAILESLGATSSIIKEDIKGALRAWVAKLRPEKKPRSLGTRAASKFSALVQAAGHFLLMERLEEESRRANHGDDTTNTGKVRNQKASLSNSRC